MLRHREPDVSSPDRCEASLSPALLSAAAVFGSSVWALHFVAMLAFLPSAAIAYDLSLTAISIAIAIVGSLAALVLWHKRSRCPVALGGAGLVLGCAITSMHYLGVAAMRASAVVRLDPIVVAASVFLCAAFATLALVRARDLIGPTRRAEVTVWLALAICGLHFIGMSALTLAPLNLPEGADHVLGSSALASAVGFVSLSILIAGLATLLLVQRKREEARIRHYALHDALTGLPNRYLLGQRLTQAMDAATQGDGGVAAIYLDLDRFKPVNDLHGHAVGDALLIQVAGRMREVLRPTDTLARVGGDEFVAVLTHVPTADQIAEIAGRLVAALSRPFEIEARRIEIGASAGAARYPADGRTAEALLHAADTALYSVKGEGRGTVRFFEPAMEAQLQARRQLESELALALGRGEFRLHYQPIVNGRTGEIETFEALIRWQHPVRGLIGPAEFIPLAEQSDLIVGLGQWVIETACADAARWPRPWRVSINVSPSQLRLSDVPAAIAAALERHELDPARMVVEITESVFIQDADAAVVVLNRLRAMGLRLALDDFGTGYSSLSYLQLFKFDKLKIDRTFVRRLGENSDTLTIVRAIVNLAHNLGMHVTAEGVETAGQLAILRALECDQMQGYLFGRPAPEVRVADTDASLMRGPLAAPLVRAAA